MPKEHALGITTKTADPLAIVMNKYELSWQSDTPPAMTHTVAGRTRTIEQEKD
jgi:hypothetical protein